MTLQRTSYFAPYLAILLLLQPYALPRAVPCNLTATSRRTLQSYCSYNLTPYLAPYRALQSYCYVTTATATVTLQPGKMIVCDLMRGREFEPIGVVGSPPIIPIIHHLALMPLTKERCTIHVALPC